MPRTVVRRPWWPLVPLLTLAAEDAAPSKLSFFGGGSSAKEAAAEAPAAPSKMSFFDSASAGDARRQEDGQDSKRAAAAAADAPKRPFFGSSSAKQAREQEEPVLSDLQPEADKDDEEEPASIFDTVNNPPPGFHRDPAGSTVAAGHHHTCALRQSSAPFGGIAHCWGEDTMGAVSRVPVELTFIQLSSGHFHSCGITLDEKLVCWGGPNPKRFEPPGLYQQVSCGAVHTCGLRKDGQVKCWFVVRRPFFFVGRHASRAFESSSVARSTLSPRLLDGVRTGRVVRHRRESDSERRAGARTTTRAARSRPLESSSRSRRATRFLVV